MSQNRVVSDRQGGDDLPDPGPPFKVGDRVAFGRTVLGPTSMWLKWEEAEILDVNAASETVGFRFVTDADDVRHAQGMETIVRVTPNYRTWRAAWDEAYARAGDEAARTAQSAIFGCACWQSIRSTVET